MKARCPKCDAPFELEQALHDQAGRDLLDEVKALGQRAGLVLEYVETFKATPASSLRAEKALRLTREVRELIESGTFQYDGQEYRVTMPVIEDALRETVARVAGGRGQTSHNYLKVCMIRMASKARTPMPRPAAPAPVIATPPQADTELVEEIRKFNETLQGIGKPMPDVTGD